MSLSFMLSFLDTHTEGYLPWICWFWWTVGRLPTFFPSIYDSTSKEKKYFLKGKKKLICRKLLGSWQPPIGHYSLLHHLAGMSYFENNLCERMHISRRSEYAYWSIFSWICWLFAFLYLPLSLQKSYVFSCSLFIWTKFFFLMWILFLDWGIKWVYV